MATLYAAKGGSATTSDLYTVDPATGVATSVGPIGFAVTGLAIDPITNYLYGATSNNSAASPKSLIIIDPTTGAGTLIGALGIGSDTCADLCFDSTGQLYGWTSSTEQLATIDKATGAATLVGSTDVTGSLSCDSGDALYRIPQTPGLDIATVDPVTGAVTPVVALAAGPGGQGPNACAFDATDVLYASWKVNGASYRLVTINVATGAVTNIGATSLLVDAVAWGDAVPPSILAANFTGTPTSGAVPLTVVFTDTSTGSPSSWAWDFGDGGTSALQNPTHVYMVPGTYDVTLTVT